MRSICPIRVAGLVAACVCGAMAAQTATPKADPPMLPGAVVQVLHPFWTRSQMDAEPVLFLQSEEGKPATGQLLFPAESIVNIRSGDGQRTYEPGKDYVWTPGSRVLTLTEKSQIPVSTMAELHPPKGSPGSFKQTGLYYVEGGAALQALQVDVTYQHKERWDGYVPKPSAALLPNAMEKLRKKEPLKVVVFGDSISHGACASAKFHKWPYQLPYAGLVVEALKTEYGGPVEMVNLSLDGSKSEWGAAHAGDVAAEHPDLVIVGFGMNDGNGVSSAQYGANIRSIMEQVRKTNPAAEFILVAPMLPNPEWRPVLEQFLQNRGALQGMVGQGVAMADMTAIWAGFLKQKKFMDLTGNGLNHPNDFGHSVYAQVIVALLQ